MKNLELIPFATADELARSVANAWLDEIETAHRARKTHCVALSGGRIAQKLFAAVVENAKARKIGDGNTPSLPGNVHFFWADERCVPPDDPDSNFRTARELLFTPLKIPESQIHRIRGEEALETAARNAGAELARVAPPVKNGQPVLDLILLGMGEDGHVASLFPNAPVQAVRDSVPFLVINDSPKPPPRRISLSYGAIAAAGQVWVLVSGGGKEGALRESLNPSGKTPLGRVIQSRQLTRIYSEIRPK